MLLKAAEEFNIDLAESFMVGDGENDIIAGKNAGCHTVLLGSEEYGQEYTCRLLEDFVSSVLHLS